MTLYVLFYSMIIDTILLLVGCMLYLIRQQKLDWLKIASLFFTVVIMLNIPLSMLRLAPLPVDGWTIGIVAGTTVFTLAFVGYQGILIFNQSSGNRP